VATLNIEAAAGIGNNGSNRTCAITPENCSSIVGDSSSWIGISKMCNNCIISNCSAFNSGNCDGVSCKSCICYRSGDIGTGDCSASGIINNYIHCCKGAFLSISVSALNIETAAGIRNNRSCRTCAITPEYCSGIIRNNASGISVGKMRDNCIVCYSSPFNGGNRIGCGCKSCICYGCGDIGSGDSSTAGIIDHNIHCREVAFFSISVAALNVEASAGIGNNCS